jgi:uncharacterized damage-inducible protein DinB
MLTQTAAQILTRDLNNLRKEIDLFPQEGLLWETPPGIANSAGNLCLHLIGNLNHFIGATLGNSGYVRNREAEFSDKNLPKAELLHKIEATIPVVQNSLQQLPEAALGQNFPVMHQNQTVSTEQMLVHLCGHLNYHLGQINYLRRLMTGA